MVATTKGLRGFDRRGSSIGLKHNRKPTSAQAGRFWRADGACDPHTRAPIAQQARRRRVEFARGVTTAEFGLFRGTRLSVSMLAHPTVPQTRGAR